MDDKSLAVMFMCALNSLRPDIEDKSRVKEMTACCWLGIMLISYPYDIQFNMFHIRALKEYSNLRNKANK